MASGSILGSGSGNDRLQGFVRGRVDRREGRQMNDVVDKRYTAVEKPPISRLALAAMASNTGCTSQANWR